MIEAGMVLAAGLGKRMRPLTATRPKPLIEIAGATLLDHALARLAAAGAKRAVVNVHYMADQVEAHLGARACGMEVRVSDERAQLLETGGGVVKALPLIGAEVFYVLNSDNFWLDGPSPALTALARTWDAAKMDALLLMVPLASANGYEGVGDFRMDAAGRLERRTGARIAPYVFGGVQILKAELFDRMSAEPFSLNRVYDRALERGRLYGLAHQGTWFHVGTPGALAQAEAQLVGG